MENNGSRDRRRYARLDLKSRVDARLSGPCGDGPCPEVFSAEGKNIGIEGICITSARELRRGDLLDLEILLPGRRDAVRIKGEVRWCALSGEDENGVQMYDAGIRFLTIDKNHVKLMVSYVCGALSGDLEGVFNRKGGRDV